MMYITYSFETKAVAAFDAIVSDAQTRTVNATPDVADIQVRRFASQCGLYVSSNRKDRQRGANTLRPSVPNDFSNHIYSFGVFFLSRLTRQTRSPLWLILLRVVSLPFLLSNLSWKNPTSGGALAL